MRNDNLARLISGAATALSVLILSAALLVSSSPAAWGGKLASYQADFSSLQAYSFAAITNTSTSANTITIKFWDNDSVATCGQSKPAVCSRTKSLAPGVTWILSSASGLSKNKATGAVGFEGTACVSDTSGDAFEYYPAVAFPVSPGVGSPLAISGFAMTPVTITSCSNCGASLVHIGVEKKNKDAAYSGYPIGVIDEQTWRKETFPSPIMDMDKKIARAFADTLNKRHVADKNVLKVGENILKTNPKIRKLIRDRAQLHKEIAKRGKAPDTTDKAAGGGKLPDCHTITITVSRDKAKGKETGKTALTGGGTPVSDVTIAGSNVPNDVKKDEELVKELMNLNKTISEGVKKQNGKQKTAGKTGKTNLLKDMKLQNDDRMDVEGEYGVAKLVAGKDSPDKASGACISAASDITNPIILNMPASESAANKAKSAVSNFAKGALGGMLGGGGGMFGGLGGGGGQAGARMVNKPKVPFFEFSNGDTNVEIGGWVYKPRSKKKKPEIRIAQRIKDSPDDGAPHMMLLQNRDGRVLRPIGYMIFELWRHWKLTITITRESYIDGALVSRSVTRESTSWDELAERYKKIMEAPGIWEQFGLAPFGKLKGIIAQFPLPEDFNPADWTLIKHDTAKAMINGKEVIKTVPFVVSIGQGEKNRLTFKTSPGGKTGYQGDRGCQSLDEAMRDLVTRYGQQSGLNESANSQKKLSKYKQKKTKKDAVNWARILILQPVQTDKWLKDYHKLSQNRQLEASVAMADIMLRIVTGTGVTAWDSGQWNKGFPHFDKAVRNLAIEAANRWKHGINKKQKDELFRSYSKLSPSLKQIFQREFIYTLAMNLVLDLRQPTPVAY